MNKKILVITPFFAPESHAAVFRAHKLVKYLKKAGWQPIVLTVDINYTYNEDPVLLDELEGIPIYRTKYIEPSLRGLYMWLTGKDRTFKTLKAKGYFEIKVNNSSANHENDNVRSISNRIYSFLLDYYLNKPDRFWTWKWSAIKKAKQLIIDEDIQFVYTTCLPFTTNQIGIALKKTTTVKWVADFRDPITYAKRMHSSISHVFKLQRKIQKDTFKFADHVTVLSSAYKLIFHDQYGGLYNHKITFIPTGLDDDYLPEETDLDNTIIFVGEYLKEYKDYFFKIFSKVKNSLSVEEQPIIKIIGNKTINELQALPFIRQWGLEKQVVFLDHMPQNQLYLEINKARYALLIPGLDSLWWTNYAKMVDYIALKKPVISLLPPISEAKNELKKAGLLILLTTDFDENVKKMIQVFTTRYEVQSHDKYCKRYLATSQTNDFIEIFEKLNGE